MTINASDKQTIDAESRPLATGAASVSRIAMVIGAIGLIVGVVFGFRDGWTVFFRSYLLNYAYVLSFALGALFFVMLQHLTRAGWSVGIRRLAEFIAGTIPVLAVFFIPLLIPVIQGMPGVFEWSNADIVAKDPLLQHKTPYLNMPFFIARCVAYFIIWSLLARYFLRKSLDAGHNRRPQAHARHDVVERAGHVALRSHRHVFLGRLLMSLNPHWFSTIWGIYYFSAPWSAFSRCWRL